MKTPEKTVNFLNNKPLCFLAFLMALRDLSIGMGYIFDLGGARLTLLYRNYDEAPWGYSGPTAGLIFVVIGMATLFGIYFNKAKIIRFALRSSALMWMFATIMYFLFDEWILSLYLGGFMMMVSGYVAYYFKDDS